MMLGVVALVVIMFLIIVGTLIADARKQRFPPTLTKDGDVWRGGFGTDDRSSGS